MNNGHWWTIRRNGKTQLWKSRAEEFRIPIKAGFRSYGELTHHSTFTTAEAAGYFRILTAP